MAELGRTCYTQQKVPAMLGLNQEGRQRDTCSHLGNLGKPQTIQVQGPPPDFCCSILSMGTATQDSVPTLISSGDE